ncbi:MAG: nitroreductase family protein [Anaerolineae bacterium]
MKSNGVPGAFTIIIAHAPGDKKRDCTIVLTYLALAAPSFGLGACWAGWLDIAADNWQPLQQYLELPEGLVCCGAMMIGYPKYKYHRIPLRDEVRITWR